MTDTAAHADIVLPATTSMEHLDLYRSSASSRSSSRQPVLPPQGEAKSNLGDGAGSWPARWRRGGAHAKGRTRALHREFLRAGRRHRAGHHLGAARPDGLARSIFRTPIGVRDGAGRRRGKVESTSARMERQGLPRSPPRAARGGPDNRELAARFRRSHRGPPNRFFLELLVQPVELLRRRQARRRRLLAAPTPPRAVSATATPCASRAPRGRRALHRQVRTLRVPGFVVIEKGSGVIRLPSPGGLGVKRPHQRPRR